jgi:hypothetical protein
MEGVFIMAQLSTHVSTASRIRVGLCAVELPADTAPMRAFPAPSLGGWFAAYDPQRMTEAELLDVLRDMLDTDLDVVTAAEAGA